MAVDRLPDPQPAPEGSYLAALEEESRRQAIRRGDGAVLRVRQRQEDIARRADEAPPPWPVIPEAAE